MSEKLYYIENVHNAPITCTGKDEEGKILTKKFYHAMSEKWTGRQLTTGFEKLTEEEFEFLSKYSRAFVHYKDNPKKTLASPLLVLHEDLPPEAKAPHEALADARKEKRKADAVIKGLESEITKLKADLLDAETKYKTLESASTDEEKLGPLNDLIADLTAKNEKLVDFANRFMHVLDGLLADPQGTIEGVKLFVDDFNKQYKALLEAEKDFE